MILEGIVTTRSQSGSLNVAPMGPIVDAAMKTLQLRPFQTSTTYANLKRQGEGVLHVVDDVLLLAQAAIGQPDPLPQTHSAEVIDGRVLSNCCRWYEFQVESIDDAQERTLITARVVHCGRVRDFFGFNRAKHAVLEAAILATRVFLLDVAEILDEFERLRIPLEKTGGPSEFAAFDLLKNHVERYAEESACAE